MTKEMGSVRDARSIIIVSPEEEGVLRQAAEKCGANFISEGSPCPGTAFLDIHGTQAQREEFLQAWVEEVKQSKSSFRGRLRKLLTSS